MVQTDHGTLRYIRLPVPFVPDGHRLVVGMFHASHDIGLKRVPFLDQLIHALGQLTINSPPRRLILFAKAIAVKGRQQIGSRSNYKAPVAP